MKLNKLLLTATLGALCTGSVLAQLSPGSENFIFNPISINPALSGLHSNQIQLGFEARWLGIEGAPKSGYLRYDKMFSENSGWNVGIISDHIGPISSFNINNGFAYHLQTFGNHHASFGIRHNLTQHYLNLTTSKLLDENDPLLAFDQNSVPINNFDAGFSWYNPESFLIGVSYRNMIPQRRFRRTQVTEDPNLSFHGWYTREINGDFAIEATAQFNLVRNSPMFMHFAAMGVFQQMFAGGINFSPSNSVGIFAFIKTKDKLNFFYNYNLPISAIYNVSKQFHAIGISYRFGKDKLVNETFFIQPTDGASGNRLF